MRFVALFTLLLPQCYALVGPRVDVPNRLGSKPAKPYDPATTKYCTWWYDNDGSILCEDMPLSWSITEDQWFRWNPSLAPSCDNFEVGKSYCIEARNEPTVTSAKPVSTTIPPVKPSSTSSTPTKPTNGITTPSPIQSNMVSNCNKFYMVQSGDSCQKIISANGLTLKLLTTWNPDIGTDCTTLWKDTWVCVSIVGFTPTIDPDNGIPTPSPIQPGMVKNCNKFYQVVKGDNCDSITSKSNILLDEFITWNPEIGGKACNGLWLNAYVCISIVGYTPTPLTQPGIAKNCDKLYKAVSGDTCEKIVNKYNYFTLSDFYKWNPAVNTDCTGLQAGYNYCVSVPMGFYVKTRYRVDCTGTINNQVSVSQSNDGVCIDTGCNVGSLEIPTAGLCPGGQVQLSYWEKPGCGGKWFGYGYASRGTCRRVWSDGWKFKSLHLRCASQSEDCTSKKTCSYDTEPSVGICQA